MAATLRNVALPLHRYTVFELCVSYLTLSWTKLVLAFWPNNKHSVSNEIIATLNIYSIVKTMKFHVVCWRCSPTRVPVPSIRASANSVYVETGLSSCHPVLQPPVSTFRLSCNWPSGQMSCIRPWVVWTSFGLMTLICFTGKKTVFCLYITSNMLAELKGLKGCNQGPPPDTNLRHYPSIYHPYSIFL
jgi:hypothetical protein